MKRLAALWIAMAIPLACTSNVAWADIPERDAEVQKLRDRFSIANHPTLEDLQPGRTWNCFFRSALPKSHQMMTVPSYFQFDADGTDNSSPLSSNGKSRIVRRYWGPKVYGYDLIRVGDSGELLIEQTSEECKGFECLFRAIATGSVDNPWAALIGYGECH